jgi:D-glycero-alpha-D-manno-heptose 1-phosphate guanylyltransferase
VEAAVTGAASDIEAVVLAGGLGTRLRGVLADDPKAMAPVAGRPFIDWLLDALNDAGIGRVVLAVGHRRERLMDHVGSRHGQLVVDYSVEESPQGTGGALRQAVELVRTPDVLVLNGDTFVDLDVGTMLATHRSVGTGLTMGVREVDDVGRFGALDIQGGRVTGFAGTPRAGAGWVNGGTYIIGEAVRPWLRRPTPYSLEADVLKPYVERWGAAAHVLAGTWIDIGVPDDLRRAQRLLDRCGAPE